jgi:hypothetical protein
MSIVKKLKSVKESRNKIVTELIETRSMLRGSFEINYRRCGKATCWCATSEEGHPCNRITGRKDTLGFTITIRKEDVEWIKQVTQAYKRFRKLRQKLRELNEEERLLLNQLEEELVEKTRKLRDYL